MAYVSAADALSLVLRLVFVLVLYGFVVAALLALRRSLRPAPSPGVDLAPAAARLTLVQAAPADGPPGRTIRLSRPVTIGRRAPADVLLQDDAVSGVHARLVPSGDGWVVEDKGSTNGTYVNGRRVDGQTPVHAGDVITTGLAAWRFEVDGA